MGYYKLRHSSERFLSPLRQFPVGGGGGGVTRYLLNVNKVNNDQCQIKWLPVFHVGIQRPHKTRSTTSDFSRFRTLYATKKVL